MRRDATLATAVAASLGYAISVGVVSSPRPVVPASEDRPVAMMVTFTDADHVLRLTNPEMMASISSWLDHAFENPRSAFDLRLLPPPNNELEIEFESGLQRKIFFSGSRPVDARTEFLRRIRQPDDVFIVQYDGSSYTTDVLPEILAAYIELAPPPSDRELRRQLREEARNRYRQEREERRRAAEAAAGTADED